MVKGFVFFKEGKIPFVIENYRMELFTDDSLLTDFAKEHNSKTNYILQGQYFGNGIKGQKATFLVEYSAAFRSLCCVLPILQPIPCPRFLKIGVL